MEPPDTEEKVIRFGCGFLFGLLLLGGWLTAWLYRDGSYRLAAVIAVATICGLLAMRHGDRFWHWWADRGRWRWW